MRISIFGIGYVGAVSSGCLAEFGHEVIAVDVSAEKVEMIRRGQSPVVEPELASLIGRAVSDGRLRATTDADAAVAQSDASFIAVGTPSEADGRVSLRAIDHVAAAIGDAIARKEGAHTVIMRSTVPPGTAEERVIPLLEQHSGRRLGQGLAYYSNPEFLREGSAVVDFRAPAHTLIGAQAGDDAALPRALYAAIAAPVHVIPYRIAESVKHLSNVYHAVKLAFANEAGAVLAACGVDARAAFSLFCEDRVLNVSPAYLRPGFAFGGSCLPKDVRSFLAIAGQHGIPAPFLSQLMPSNAAIIERSYEEIARRGRQRVSLFGLSFKPATDDLRESPFVRLAERLIGRGYDLRIFDRSVRIATLLGANRSYIDREIPHLERLMTASPAEALDGSRLVVFGHIAAEDKPALLAGLTDQTVLDLAGSAELQALSGITYQGLCW
jgi:GDP-mannose 6-dehydrogenase